MSNITGAVVAAFFLMFSTSVGAETYYAIPPDSLPANTPDGSAQSPFIGVSAAFKSGLLKSGDTLLLRAGKYGPLTLRNIVMDGPVTIRSETNRDAHFDAIMLSGTTRNLTFQNLSIWPQQPDTAVGYRFITDPTTSAITVSGMDIRSDQDAMDYVNWTEEKWNKRKVGGIRLDGANSRALKNTLTGIYVGISTSGANAEVTGNLVKGYNGDGLRPLGTDNVYRNNTVIDCVDTDDNHDDGIQSFATVGGVVKGLVIDGNIIFEWTKAPTHPLRCRLQGIGFFDGFYDQLTITNNLVTASQYHGISVYGARGAVIANNTVVNSLGVTGVTPYIAVYNHKNGTPPSNVMVANNVAMSIQGTANVAGKVEFRDNSVIGTPQLVFQDPANFDYRPKAESGYIDSAAQDAAPAYDIDGRARPTGAGPDRGAYESTASDISAAPPPPPPPVSPPMLVVRRAGVVASVQTAAPAATGARVSNPALLPDVLPLESDTNATP